MYSVGTSISIYNDLMVWKRVVKSSIGEGLLDYGWIE